MRYQNIADFVTDGKFVNPEKVTAIDLYGFETAKKTRENGEPDFTTRIRLSTIACQKAPPGHYPMQYGGGKRQGKPVPCINPVKKLIVNTIARILVTTDWGTPGICFYLIMTDQKDSAGLPATICAISAFLSPVFMVVDVCIIEEGGTKPL